MKIRFSFHTSVSVSVYILHIYTCLYYNIYLILEYIYKYIHVLFHVSGKIHIRLYMLFTIQLLHCDTFVPVQVSNIHV